MTIPGKTLQTERNKYYALRGSYRLDLGSSRMHFRRSFVLSLSLSFLILVELQNHKQHVKKRLKTSII